jgi:DNA-binding NarL/FixJ family response regulator
MVPDESLFVGRSTELEKLHARLARARSGSGAVVALVGEPGIGKTRTALAFAERARDEGAVVAVGSCAEGEWGAPLHPWSQALGAIARDIGDKGVNLAAGAARGTLAWFVPEVKSRFPAPQLDPRDERVRLHHSVTALLQRATLPVRARKGALAASESRPLVLVIDDLQWVDADSLELLEDLARQASTSPWVIVLAYREGEVDHGRTPLGDVLGVLKDGDFERISLRGLSLAEVKDYAQRCAGRSLTDAFARLLFDETVGNPFYVREVVQLLTDEGQLARLGGPGEISMRQLGVPRGVREVVAKRFARLPEPAARVLRVSSSIAEPIDAQTLLAVTELEEKRLRGAITVAVGSGLLRKVEDGTPSPSKTAVRGRFEPSHAIVRRVVHDGLQADLRVRLHRRMAEALEDSGERRPGLEAIIAGEYYASSALSGAELGVPHAIEAAREAMAACAHERAVAFLRRARSLAASAPPHIRAEALCELALAEARALHAEDAARSTTDALAALEETGAAREDVAAFLADVARELKNGGAPHGRWTPLVARGLELANGGRSLTWARLSLMDERFEALAYGAVNLSRALPRDADAVKRARQDGDEDDYASTVDDAPRTRAEAEQLVRLSNKWARPAARLRALDVAIRELIYRHAAFVDARKHVETMLHVATRAGSIRGQAEALVHHATCAAALGSIERALESRARARDLAVHLGASYAQVRVPWLGLDGMLAYYVGGDWRALAEAAARATADPSARRSPEGHVAAAIAALAYALAGHARESRALLGHLAAIFERCDAHLYHYGVALGCATTAVWHLGARDLAEKYRALERGAPPLAGAAPYSSRDVNLGRMAVLLEDWSDAAEHMTRADVLLARRGLRPVHAIALHDGAAAAIRSGDEAGVAKARVKLAASLRTFRLLGMEPWIVHAHQLLDLPRPAYPDGLTSREVEILAMIGEGHEPDGIATALGVAMLVARKETARAYAKIGARTRRAAAAYAIDHRFVAPP